jgi:hypoxanthine phosphoribosyltransferase
MKIEPLISEERIQGRVRELAAELAAKEMSHPPVCLMVLQGAVPFARDLAGHLDMEGKFEEVAVSSYLGTTSAQRNPVVVGKLPESIRGRHVLVIDDILDTGRTLDFLHRTLVEQGALDVRFCVLLRKDVPRVCDVAVEYVGFDIQNEFVVGYGLDFQGDYRGLPYVGVFCPDGSAEGL